MNSQKYWGSSREDNNLTNKITTVLFIIYLIALLWILVFKLGARISQMGNWRSINLIPFNAPLVLNGETEYGESILNVIVFIPLGIYAGILFRNWSFVQKLFFFFLVSFIVETLQYILAIGTSDVTDIITNTSGGVIGLIVLVVIEKAFNNNIKAQKFINIIAAIGTAVMVSLMILLKANMLPVKYQ